MTVDWIQVGAALGVRLDDAVPGESADAFQPWLAEALRNVVAGHQDAPPGPHRGDYNYWVHLVVHEDEDGRSSRAAAIDADLCARLRD